MELWKEREALKKARPTRSWATKVNRMDQIQIHAVYMSFKKRGLL
jgi:hypothetical protein